MILENTLAYSKNNIDTQVDLSTFLESLNSIEMMMDLLTHNTIQSTEDNEVINSMWALNSSVMAAIVTREPNDT